MIRSPETKAFLEKHGGRRDEDGAFADPLEILLSSLPSADSLGVFFRTFFEDGHSGVDLSTKAESMSHPRERNEPSWEALVGLAPSVKSKSSLVSNVLISVIDNCAKACELDFLAILRSADEHYAANLESFVFTNDKEEELPDFKCATITSLAEMIDASKGHDCAKINKDRVCVIIKTCIVALCDRLVNLCAYSLKTPAHRFFTGSESNAELRLDSLETVVGKVSTDLTALTLSIAKESSIMTERLESVLKRVSDNTDLMAALMKQQLQAPKSNVSLSTGSSKVPSVSNSLAPSMSKDDILLTPAESLAASGVGGVVSNLTATDAKGIESVDNVLSCMFVSGEKPQSARRKPQFLDNHNSLPKLIEFSKGFLPRISVETVTLSKGETVDLNRTVFRAGAATVARKINYLPALVTNATAARISKYKVALSSHEGLPMSLMHMIKMLYDDLEELRVFNDFLPFEMDLLIEREIGRFVSLMSSLWVSLVDSSDSTVCISHEGIWRGVIHLFYHQYLDSFSCSERGLFQTFYPEMLCNSFETNSAYLLRFYNWKSAQLTGSVHNYIRSSCPRCLQSKLSAVCCITPACIKLREEEANLHVYLNSNGKPQAVPFKV